MRDELYACAKKLLSIACRNIFVMFFIILFSKITKSIINLVAKMGDFLTCIFFLKLPKIFIFCYMPIEGLLMKRTDIIINYKKNT